MTRPASLPLALLLGPLLLLSRGANGQAVCTTGKIALVRTRAILASVERYGAQQDALTLVVNSYRVDVSQLQGVMDSVTRAYQEKSALLSAGARQVEVGKLDAQSAQVQQRIQLLQSQVARQRERLLQPTEIGVQAVIDSIRVELKCAIILDVSSGSGIASVNKTLDVTQRVIDRLKTNSDTALFGPLPGTPSKRP
jgi:Outer membrane protein (OmpH-like)